MSMPTASPLRLRSDDGLREAVEEECAIGQTGQRVVRGLMHDLIFAGGDG